MFLLADTMRRQQPGHVRFTPNGLEKVEIDDETALESMDWDMSLRRFILRLNGGATGASRWFHLFGEYLMD